MASENSVNCYICYKKVEIVSTTRISNDEVQDNFSCGHNRRRFNRIMTESISIPESLSIQGTKSSHKINNRILNFFKK
jgi:hypothetical protein